MSNRVVEDLKKVLANTYILYLKTQNYHWNVSGGPYFKTLHELFDMHYNELADAVDEIAERIRQLGHKTPASFSEFNSLAVIAEGKSTKDAQQMLVEITEDQKLMVKILRDTLHESDEARDDATSDMLIKRIAAHEKAAWFYSSSLA